MSALRMLNNRFIRVVVVAVALVCAGAMVTAQQLAQDSHVAQDVDETLIERHTTTPLTRQPMVLALLLLMVAGGLIFALQPTPSKTVHTVLHDALTGLPNRALLSDRLGHALSRAHRKGKRVGLLTIDLGRNAGDTALVEVARRLEEVVRESDTLARVGGDQFIVVMEELDGEYAAAELAACAVAAKCLDAVLPAITLKDSAHQLGASAGIALSDEYQSQEALQVASHYALQEAKRAGGDRYFVATLAAIPAKPAIASA